MMIPLRNLISDRVTLSISCRRTGLASRKLPDSARWWPTARQRTRNHRFGKVRARVEHVFRVVKCQFGYRKVRLRGIAKNGAQVFSLLALANLYLARRRCAFA
jgi:IS5 family transposase